MAIKTINLTGGASGVDYGAIYFNTTKLLFYSDSGCTNQIVSVAVPYFDTRKFAGYYNQSTGSKLIDENGVISSSWKPTGSATTITLTAHWTRLSYRFKLQASDGVTIPTAAIYRSTTTGTSFYLDGLLTNGPITSIPTPNRSGYAFNCATVQSTSGGTVDINSYGVIQSHLATVNPSGTPTEIVLYLWWLRCYNATLNASGGSGGMSTPIWYDRIKCRWCSDDYLQNVITSVPVPSKAGKIFNGYYTASSGGTQVIDANGVLGTYSAVESANKTVYAQWANPVTITVNQGGGTGGIGTIYYGGGQFFTTSELTTPVTSVPVPTLANHRFLGYYSGSTQVIDASGNIRGSWAPSSAVTITAQWERVSYTINVQANGGGGVSAIYANAARTAVYADEMCSGSQLTSITPLTRAGYRFMGLYATNAVSGTQLVDASGNFTASFASFLSGITDTVTVYALWQQVFTIQLDADGGSGAPGEIYFDDAYGQFYDDPAMTTPVSSIAVPTKECYQFDGFYSSSGGGTERISASGVISSGWIPTAGCTIYAQWTRRSYKYILDTAGGATMQPAIFNNGSSSTYYVDDALTTVATTVALPTKPGNTFAGYYNGGTQVINAAGDILLASPITDDTTATASWTVNTYTINFDYNGGTGSTSSKQVTYGQPIGQLPTCTRSRGTFAAWVMNGAVVTSESIYNVPDDSTATAQWNLQFGGVTDWFNLSSMALRPISSSSGDNRQRICVNHTGHYEPNVTKTSGVWRNPTVTYQVVQNCTLTITLGRAYAGTTGISGYMIVSVKVSTAVGKFPTVTVTATANEGVNAINTFPVTVSILGRARVQNLLNAVQGGGQLQSCNLQASCAPVVIEEDNMPCASDVVGGRITIDGTTYAPNMEAAPTAGSGFTEVGTPKQCGDKNYLMWETKMEKDL